MDNCFHQFINKNQCLLKGKKNDLNFIEIKSKKIWKTTMKSRDENNRSPSP